MFYVVLGDVNPIGGNFNPFLYEWVDLSCIGQTKNLAERGSRQTGSKYPKAYF